MMGCHHGLPLSRSLVIQEWKCSQLLSWFMGVPLVPASVYSEHIPASGWCPLAFVPSATCQKVWERLSGGGMSHWARQKRAHSWWKLVGNFPVKLALLGNVETVMCWPGGMSGQNQRQETHHRTVWQLMQQCGRISFISMLCTTSSLHNPVDVLTTRSPSTQSHLSAPHGAAAQIYTSNSGTYIHRLIPYTPLSPTGCTAIFFMLILIKNAVLKIPALKAIH